MAIQSSDIGGENDPRQFDALANDRRCQVLVTLHDSGTPLSVPELADILADREVNDTAFATKDDDLVDQLKIVLHHRHLPKLADAGLVEYDVDEKMVSLTTTVNEMDSVDELLDVHDE